MMGLPLELDYDYDPDTGSESSILDAERRMLVEEPGPEGTWRDLELIVDMVNQRAELVAALEALSTCFSDTIRDHLGDDPEEWECYTAAGRAISAARKLNHRRT